VTARHALRGAKNFDGAAGRIRQVPRRGHPRVMAFRLAGAAPDSTGGERRYLGWYCRERV